MFYKCICVLDGLFFGYKILLDIKSFWIHITYNTVEPNIQDALNWGHLDKQDRFRYPKHQTLCMGTLQPLKSGHLTNMFCPKGVQN